MTTYILVFILGAVTTPFQSVGRRAYLALKRRRSDV